MRIIVASTLGFLLIGSAAMVPNQSKNAPQVKPIKTLMVVDATNKVVGYVLSINFQTESYRLATIPTVSLQYRDQVVVVGVTPDHFIGQDPTLLFDGPECTGTPYLRDLGGYNYDHLTPQSFVMNDGTLVVADPAVSSAPVAITVESYLDNINAPNPSVCEPGGGYEAEAIRTSPPVNLNQLFQGPFRLQAQ
ncbi:MAG TPA: hypothetical protein VG028_17010 [Terriglobia bacterium]|nr:hypothetical protein [Terriglobia bacterium]